MFKSNEYNERVSFVKIKKVSLYTYCACSKQKASLQCGLYRTYVYVDVYNYTFQLATSEYACHVADTTSTTSTSDEGTSKEAKIAVEEVE